MSISVMMNPEASHEEILTSESSDDSSTDYPLRTMRHEDLRKVRFGGASLSNPGEDKKCIRDCGKLLVGVWRCFIAFFLRLLHACGMKKRPRSTYTLQGGDSSQVEPGIDEIDDHYLLCSSWDGRGTKFRTSGNRIFFDVQRGVSPPRNTNPPPRKELPKPISPKQVEPAGTHSKKIGCLPWGKGKGKGVRIK